MRMKIVSLLDILVFCFSNGLIFIEEEDYEIIRKSQVLSEQILPEKTPQEPTFWNNATKYASVSNDESFVEEVAYMMVTLHRTGA